MLLHRVGAERSAAADGPVDRASVARALSSPALSTVTLIRAPIAARLLFTPTSRTLIQSLPCPGFSNSRSA